MEVDESVEDRVRHREWLIEKDYQAAVEFDRTVMTLAGGALAVSLGFMRPRPGGGEISAEWLLALAWVLLIGSLLATLIAQRTTQTAFRNAIIQLDRGRIDRETPGGHAAALTIRLNWAALWLVVIGIIFLTFFSWQNLGKLA